MSMWTWTPENYQRVQRFFPQGSRRLAMLKAACSMLSVPVWFAYPALLAVLWQAQDARLLRVLLVGILFGNAFSLAFSAAGAIVSLAVMLPLSRAHPDNTILVCVAGGVAHNAGQILAAGLLTHAWQIAWYFLVLCLTGILAGIGIGLLSAFVLRQTRHILL